MNLSRRGQPSTRELIERNMASYDQRQEDGKEKRRQQEKVKRERKRLKKALPPLTEFEKLNNRLARLPER